MTINAGAVRNGSRTPTDQVGERGFDSRPPLHTLTLPHATVIAGCSACDYGTHLHCSACGCEWDRDIAPRNAIGDACRDIECACHGFGVWP